ncbi:MAG: SCO family protein [Burkholderiales bacterium]
MPKIALSDLIVMPRSILRWGGVFFVLCLEIFCTRIAVAHEITNPTQADFAPPAPGSYRLNHIMQVPDGTVLDVENKPRPLSNFTTGKVTLLGFIYTTCSDAKGCPLAYKVFYDLKREIEKTPWMHDKVRFVSLSFDPLHDTPDVMRLYGGDQWRTSKYLQWDFLTTSSYKTLQPLLDGFGQDVSVETDPQKNSPRAFSHVLKIFLIDETGSVREIYTSSYLIEGMVLNDIKTLLMEKRK